MRLTRLSRGWLAAFVLGGMVAVPQVANATLIGDNIMVTTATAVICIAATPCVDGDGTAGGGLLVVDDELNPELQTGDGSDFASFFSGLQFMGGSFLPTGSIDIRDSSIFLTFSFGAGSPGFQGTFTFESLDWVNDVDATIFSVTCVEDSGSICLSPPLGSAIQPALIGSPGNAFSVTIDCILMSFGGACTTVSTISILLNITPTEHNGNGVPVPEPSSIMLFGAGLGMLGLMVMTRRRRQAA